MVPVIKLFLHVVGSQVRAFVDLSLLRPLNNAVSIFGNLCGALVVDRVGRKPLMLWAFIGCTCCLSLEAAMIAVYAEAGTNKVGLGFALFASYAFSVFYTPGVDCVNAIFLGELFPNHLRAKGVTAALVVYALTDLVYLQVAPTAFENVGWKFYLVSSGC